MKRKIARGRGGGGGGFIERFGAVMHDVGDGMLVLSCSNKRKNRGHGRTPTIPGEEMARNREVVACHTR